MYLEQNISWFQVQYLQLIIKYLIYSYVGTQELLNMVEAFNKKCTTYDDWLTQSENMMVDCGPIEADIERLTQQEVILEVNVYN